MGADDVKAIRDELGWTQAEMARALGVDPATVSRWERGRYEVDSLAEGAILRARDLGLAARPSR